MYHYLYQTTNNINGKIYIGVHSTVDLNDGYIGSGELLKKAIRKHGKENFSCDPLEFFETREEAFEAERKTVDTTFVGLEYTYNLKEGGHEPPIMIGKENPMFGKEKSNHTKERISESLKTFYKENGYTPPNKGKTLSKEWRENIGKSRIGSKHSKESIEKMKESRKGFKHSEASKQKLSLAHKGKKLSDSHKYKISVSVSESLKGKPKSESHKQKLRESGLKRKIKGSNNPNSKCVQHISTGLFFPCLKEACEVTGINYTVERGRMSTGKNKNFIYI